MCADANNQKQKENTSLKQMNEPPSKVTPHKQQVLA
jgi:hypothetical protein